MTDNGSILLERELVRQGDGYKPGQGQVKVVYSSRLRHTWTAQISYVNVHGEAVLISAYRAYKPKQHDVLGDPVPTDTWKPYLGACSLPDALSRLIPAEEIHLTDKMIAACDDAAQRLPGKTRKS